jgi:hypothetical protein
VKPAWKEQAQRELLGLWRHPRLDYLLDSWTRGGNFFDLDNLCKPILELIGRNAEAVWARMQLGEPAGLYVSEELPVPPPAASRAFEVRNPPRRSVKGVPALKELDSQLPIPGDDSLGVDLAFFDAAIPVADFGFEGPVKALLDALKPLFGTYSQSAKDYRIRELRIRRGVRPEADGVLVTIWSLESD